MTNELAPLVARQSEAQAIVHDRAGNLVLNVLQLRCLAIVPLRPQLPARGHVDKAGRDQQPRGVALQRTRENRLDPELSSCGRRIHRLAAERKHRRQIGHSDRAQIRGLLDEALRNALAQVFEILVFHRILEWQHGERSNLRACRP
jgi:hypothetical protein